MVYNADVTLTLDIQYRDIEAESEEEAKFIARQRAYEDVDWNNEADVFVWKDDE